MKKFMKIVASAFLAGSMLAGCASGGGSASAAGSGSAGSSTGSDGDTIKIGTIYAMSGDKAAIGENILRGVDFAVKEINDNGGVDGKKLEVVRGDHQGSPDVGKSEAERLITQEHVDVLMGCHMSTVTEVVAQVANQYKVPMITAISTLDMLSNEKHKDYSYFFRLCPLNSVYVEDMLKYLKDSSEQTGEEIKSIAVFTDKAAIGQELIRCVELYKDEYGFDYLGEVDYSGGASDLSSQVLALKQMNPDAILCDSYIADATLFINTLKQQNYKPKMIVAKANGFTDPNFISQLGSAANGVASVVEFNPDMTNGAEINEEFKKEYDVDMNGHSAESYTTVWLFKEAIEKAGSTDGTAIRDALAELDVKDKFEGCRNIVLPYSEIKFEAEYQTADGETHYRDNTYSSVAIAQVQDGEWKTVWPFDFASAKIQYPAALQ
jgi:branched-chain amino acid transport system substrate-binding protein